MTEPRDYFVSIRRDSRSGLLAGPFATHSEALFRLDDAKRMACKLDPWADFDAFGTMSLPSPSGRVGVLNDRLGVGRAADEGATAEGRDMTACSHCNDSRIEFVSAGHGNVLEIPCSMCTHNLFETGDPDAPDCVKDRNGEVVLGLCRRCRKGEAELDGPCNIS